MRLRNTIAEPQDCQPVPLHFRSRLIKSSLLHKIGDIYACRMIRENFAYGLLPTTTDEKQAQMR